MFQANVKQLELLSMQNEFIKDIQTLRSDPAKNNIRQTSEPRSEIQGERSFDIYIV